MLKSDKESTGVVRNSPVSIHPSISLVETGALPYPYLPPSLPHSLHLSLSPSLPPSLIPTSLLLTLPPFLPPTLSLSRFTEDTKIGSIRSWIAPNLTPAKSSVRDDTDESPHNYPPGQQDWTVVQRGVRIPWDLEGTPLQIKTDSTLDSDDVIMVDMYEGTSYIGYVRVLITTPNVMWYLEHCAPWDNLPVQPPREEVDKIWTISKTETALIITCNDVEVLNYLFADSSDSTCVPRWIHDVENIEFNSPTDTASDIYRAAPIPECPAFTVERSTQGNWDASPAGTIVTVDCIANHILDGSETLTCQEDGTWSNDVPQCDTIGKYSG
eukprot:sb/3466744/